MSGGELFVIIFAAIMLFGTKRIPDIAKALGKAMREFKRATDEIKREISESEINKDIKDIEKDLKG
jgi:sec-independent protein translocase protein TatA